MNRTPVFTTGSSTITVLGSSLQHVNGNWVWNDVSVNPSTSYTYTMVPILMNGTASSGITATVKSSRIITDPSYSTYLSYDTSNLNVAIFAPNPLYNCTAYGGGSSTFMVSWTGGTGVGVIYSYTLSNGTIADISGTNPTQITITSPLVITTTVTVTATNVIGSVNNVSNPVTTTSKLGPAGLVALGNDGQIYKSTDNGRSWTKQTISYGSSENYLPQFYTLLFCNNIYVAFGSHPYYYIMTSPDAVTWTGTANSIPHIGFYALASGAGPYALTYANNLFFLSVSYNTNTSITHVPMMFISSDVNNLTSVGTQTPISPGTIGSYFGMCIAHVVYNSVLGMYIATCNNNAYNNIGYSYDATTWITSTAGTGNGGKYLAYRPTDGLTVLVGNFSFNNTRYQTFISTDGKNWTNPKSPFGQSIYGEITCVTYANGIFMMGSITGNDTLSVPYTVFRSTDGITWTGSLLASVQNDVRVLKYFSIINTWFSCGVGNNYIYYSTNNGSTWTMSTMPLDSQGHPVGVTGIVW